MKTYSITYDLGNPGRDYDGVAEAIKSLADGFCRPTLSQWLINSDFSAATIRDTVSKKLNSGDKLLVNEVGDLWSSWGLGDANNGWLKIHWSSSCRV